MDGNITINIVEPGTPPSPTPAPVTPNTGLFTSGIGGPEATAIGAVLTLTIAAIVVAFLYRKQKKSGKVTKLVHLVDSTKAVITNKKRITVGLTALALLASAGIFAALLSSTNKNNTNAAEGEDSTSSETASTITPIVSDNELTIEVGDEPVFAVLPVEITVEQVTEAGYTLTVYADSTDLVSTTNPDNKIPMIAVEGEQLSALTDNTYGLALTEPEDKDSDVYTTLSTSQDNPTFITDKDYEATDANDKTTIYYGFYITPDVPYGTYASTNIYYNVEINRTDFVRVTFDGNGLYFGNDPSRATNTVKYIPGGQSASQYSHTPNLDDGGVKNDYYPTDSNETFVYSFPNFDNVHVAIIKTGNDACWTDRGDYFSIWPGNRPDKTALSNWSDEDSIKVLDSDGRYVFGGYNNQEFDIEGVDSITIAYTTSSSSQSCGGSGYGYYIDVSGYRLNDDISGKYQTPSSAKAVEFIGWSLDQDAAVPEYTSEAEVERYLNLESRDVTLYAVWRPIFEIYYNGNGADTITTMEDVRQYTANLDGTSEAGLLASNYQRTGYGFVGWSTDAEAWSHLTDDDETNNPTIYGSNQSITVSDELITEAGEDRKLFLNAVWVPVETDTSGVSVSLQNWQGCSVLTPTSYDSETKTFIVDKNTVTALADSRDGNVYAVARLADGNCWMMENLRLDSTTESISSINTDNPTNDFTLGLSIPAENWCNYEWNDDPEIKAECINRSTFNSDNTKRVTISPLHNEDFTSYAYYSGFDDNIYSYGNYYNWYSATAGNGRYETGLDADATGSICPAGWSLPEGGEEKPSGSFYYLGETFEGNLDSYGGEEARKTSNRWRTFPNNFVFSGSIYRQQGDESMHLMQRGTEGRYITATSEGDNGVRIRSIGVSGTTDSSSMYKSNGGAVRCVAPAE